MISPDFLRKEWPQKELDGLVAREVDGVKVILPVWHKITRDQILAYSPPLADRLAASSDHGLDHVLSELTRAIASGNQATQLPGSSRKAPVDGGRVATNDPGRPPQTVDLCPTARYKPNSPSECSGREWFTTAPHHEIRVVASL